MYIYIYTLLLLLQNMNIFETFCLREIKSESMYRWKTFKTMTQ